MVSVISADWATLIATAVHLRDATDATDAVLIERLSPDVAYNKVLSVHQAWKNKYARCAQRDLIEVPYRIRRNPLPGGGYDIEAVRDLTALIEGAMVDWPGGEPDG